MRRKVFRNGGLGLFAAPFLGPLGAMAAATGEKKKAKGGSAKNIIFMVSDGMSTGTLNMADMLLQRKEGRRTNWLSLYETGQGTRALMDTASASSLVTDSAAASSSWGGGVRVPNGSINVGANGQAYQPILQKFKAAGKSVGCVTTVPITHATPAGFCVNSRSRGDQEEIAVQYTELKFDVMMGGGNEFFDAAKRKDKRDVYADFVSAGYEVVKTGTAMEQVSASSQKPLLAVFSDNGLPYTPDANNDKKTFLPWRR
ncbi:alkaline phosphatase [Chitinophaga sedimenti]|uniref:alkaline phosphatase n=1 Tax=Chitinophaga sedimenti TaxID=2033606 RepID=UPI00249DD921|nr:alkaline phosphatase [Chitinophaga sedimenti]